MTRSQAERLTAGRTRTRPVALAQDQRRVKLACQHVRGELLVAGDPVNGIAIAPGGSREDTQHCGLRHAGRAGQEHRPP
jgi:hypothetical protein